MTVIDNTSSESLERPLRSSIMRWVSLAALHGEALPNVMRKVVAHAGIVP